MSDCISREAAIEELRKAADCANCNAGAGGLCGFCDIENAARLINGIPAADVEPVRHGRWGKKQGGFWEFANCSVCGQKTATVGIPPNYCPNCGAKMDLEGETNDD